MIAIPIFDIESLNHLIINHHIIDKFEISIGIIVAESVAGGIIIYRTLPNYIFCCVYINLKMLKLYALNSCLTESACPQTTIYYIYYCVIFSFIGIFKVDCKFCGNNYNLTRLKENSQRNLPSYSGLTL